MTEEKRQKSRLKSAAWREKNSERLAAYQKAAGKRYSDRFRTLISEYKSGKPCLDCSEHFPQVVMEFDHVRGQKRCDISKMMFHSVASIQAEIAKCELVCSNCHNVRTFTRNNSSQRVPGTGKHAIQRDRVRRYLFEYKSNNPCSDCCKNFHPCAMEFDHVRGQKTSDISKMKMMSIARVQEEMSKCELVCSNCHQIRTFTRSNAKQRTAKWIIELSKIRPPRRKPPAEINQLTLVALMEA